MHALRTRCKGFTLVELMVAIAIFGILVGIGVPNYFRFANRAKEAVVKGNVHTVQSAMEVYLVDSPEERYPKDADEVDLKSLLPKGVYPRNPFTDEETNVLWGSDPTEKGELAIFNLPEGGYMIKAHGAYDLLLPHLVVGS